MLNLFSFHLISSHRSFSWKLLTASHCHRSLCHPISSQLISCLLSFSPHLSSSQLMSSYLSSFDVISFSAKSSKSTCSLVVFHGCLSHVKTSDLSSVFLHLPFSRFPKPNKTPQQLFPCRRHEKFRVVVSAVSEPWVHWDAHSKPSRKEAPTQKGYLHSEAFTHSKLSHRESFAHRSFYTQ